MAIDVKDFWLTGNDFFGEALWSNSSKLNSPGVQSSKPNDHSSISRISEILGGEEKIHHIVSRLKSCRENHSSILSCDSPATVLSQLFGLLNTTKKFSVD